MLQSRQVLVWEPFPVRKMERGMYHLKRRKKLKMRQVNWVILQTNWREIYFEIELEL